MSSQIVAVTGASSGAGRAIALGFAEQGATVGLIARGKKALKATAKEVEARGGTAVVLPCDVADSEAVEAAAEALEQHGPIDVWVNNAMASVFAPTWEITPEEFHRVTSVTYLGFVYGTLAALSRMRPRNTGVIVQVGSALAYRGIPLQSPYCACKHAIQGFTESLRCELLHEHSGVRVTMVQMPALNTPQFDAVRSRLPRHPMPVPPIYEPELAARAVLTAAANPGRREWWVGASTAVTLIGNAIAPGIADRYLARTGFDSQQTDQPVPPGRPDNLYEPLHVSGSARGDFTEQSHSASLQWTLTRHRRIVWSAMAAAAVSGVGAFAAIRGTR